MGYLDRKVPRDEIIYDMSYRYFCCFLRTKTKDLLRIRRIVSQMLPENFVITRRNYIMVGIDIPMQNDMHNRIQRFFNFPDRPKSNVARAVQKTRVDC